LKIKTSLSYGKFLNKMALHNKRSTMKSIYFNTRGIKRLKTTSLSRKKK